MSAKADSMASDIFPAERGANDERSASSGYAVSGHWPVFEALNTLGLTGRDIAEMADVTPPTVSKWRSGKVRIPGEKILFLTSALGHLLGEMEKMPVQHARLESNPESHHGAFAAAQAHLRYQELLNQDLPATEMHTAMQRFSTWWASGAAQNLIDRRIRPIADADALEMLKRMKGKQ